jgi:hypothetical protein
MMFTRSARALMTRLHYVICQHSPQHRDITLHFPKRQSRDLKLSRGARDATFHLCIACVHVREQSDAQSKGMAGWRRTEYRGGALWR